jgi:hypothetical protein
MRYTKARNPERFCAYEHCSKRLSRDQLRWNAEQKAHFNEGRMARYCCRAHKELAAQQRRRARRAEARAWALAWDATTGRDEIVRI